MVFWYLAVWWPSAVERNQEWNSQWRIAIDDALWCERAALSMKLIRAVHSLWCLWQSNLVLLPPHKQTHKQTQVWIQKQLQMQTHKHKHTSINTQTITGTKTQAYTSTNIQANISTNAQANTQTITHKHLSMQIKIDKFIPLVHYNYQDARLIDVCQCQSEKSVWMRRIRERANGWWE